MSKQVKNPAHTCEAKQHSQAIFDAILWQRPFTAIGFVRSKPDNFAEAFKICSHFFNEVTTTFDLPIDWER